MCTNRNVDVDLYKSTAGIIIFRTKKIRYIEDTCKHTPVS